MTSTQMITIIAVITILAIILEATLFLQIRRIKEQGNNESEISDLKSNLTQLSQEIITQRQDTARESRANREEINKQIQGLSQTLHGQITQLGTGQLEQLTKLTQSNGEDMERLRKTMDTKLAAIQTDNAKKLEEMRITVDEKLSSTLNSRLNESFSLVTERLEQVHKGLGEMQSLSTNLTDIKKIFSNVKSRGIWGEVQLGAILEDTLTGEQYDENVAINPRSDDKVEFAVKIPKRDQDQGFYYLPIDAKFPVEDYNRLLEAQENGDVTTLANSRKALETNLKNSAKTIKTKYILPPVTLDYAIMFLPTEGLYAEAIRLTGFMDFANKNQIMVAGPTNLAALLNSIKMGFRTLAIQEKSGEIRKTLGAVKTDMAKFAAALEKAQKKISEADNTLADAAHRTEIITKKLKNIEAAPLLNDTTEITTKEN